MSEKISFQKTDSVMMIIVMTMIRIIIYSDQIVTVRFLKTHHTSSRAFRNSVPILKVKKVNKVKS